jgi:5-methylcytosine-specific restriction protein A
MKQIFLLFIILGLLVYYTESKLLPKETKQNLMILLYSFFIAYYLHYINDSVTIKITKNGITIHKNKKYNKDIQQKKYKRGVSGKLKKIIASSQKWKCAKCHNIFDASYEIDHINPLYKGGNNSINNLQALCRNCHGKKTFYDSIFK